MHLEQKKSREEKMTLLNKIMNKFLTGIDREPAMDQVVKVLLAHSLVDDFNSKFAVFGENRQVF